MVSWKQKDVAFDAIYKKYLKLLVGTRVQSTTSHLNLQNAYIYI